jgi:AGCS family alanine or glycine:cation symporter
VFWMWVSAFLSAMTGWGEKALSVLVRRRTAQGWQGGAMVWLEELHLPVLAKLAALFTALAALGMGDMVQANALATAVEAVTGCPPLLTGMVTAALCAGVLLGGLGRIGKLCERLVPCMAALFLAGGLVTLYVQREALPQVFELIFRSALSPEAVGGGTLGSALRWGVARGICTNEAGLGSTALVHCSSRNNDPVKEGYWGIVEVFFATFVVCTITALVVLSSQAYRTGAVEQGAALSVAAFQEGLGSFGGQFVSICLAVFAFSTLLGWCWYGCCGVRYLLSPRWEGAYRLLFLGCIVVGSVGRVEAVWLLSDLFNGLMACPSLIALLLSAPKLLPLLQNGGERGIIPVQKSQS